MISAITKLIYSLLLYLVIPIELGRLYWRGRIAPAYRLRWTERFAINLPPVKKDGIWVHAASVGEFFAVLPVIEELFKIYPNTTIIVTTMTPTGSRLVKERLADRVYHVYVPFDLPDAVARFIRHVQPQKLLIMETELWPNLIAEAARRSVDIILMNARLSERSARGYQFLRSLTQTTIRKITVIAAQHKDDAARFLALGANTSSIHITGSIKFDIKIKETLLLEGQILRQKFKSELVWIAASTHSGEDLQVLQAHKLVREKYPSAQLILVPRHPERFNEVAAVCAEENFSFSRRSLDQATDQAVYLGDTMGELVLLYAVADMAFVGGSLVETGGHNILEPAALSKPVLTGPHDFNFRDVNRQMIAASAAIRIENAQQLAQQIIAWQDEPAKMKEVGRQALAVVQKNQGALKRLLTLIEYHQ